MSAELLGLAFKAQMGSHVAKLVLLKLVDAAEDDGTSIYPAIATIAKAAEAHERTVQKVLRSFEQGGLLILVRQGGGGPGDTTEYRLDLDVLRRLREEQWAVVTADSTLAESGGKGGLRPPLADDDKGGVRPPLDEERVASDSKKGGARATQPLQDPSKEERESAREAGKGKAAEQLLALKRMHPASSQEDPLVVAALWDELTAAERNAAVDRHADWLEDGRRAKRTVVPKLAFYLGKKLWNELPPRQAGAAAKPAGDRAWLGGFDRPWWCFVFGMIARDRASLADRAGAPARALQRVFSLATSRLGTPIPSEDLPALEEAALRMVKLHIQSAEWSAWRGAVYQAFRFHLPAPSATDWVWVPARTPAEWLDPSGAAILPPIEPTKGAA